MDEYGNLEDLYSSDDNDLDELTRQAMLISANSRAQRAPVGSNLGTIISGAANGLGSIIAGNYNQAAGNAAQGMQTVDNLNQSRLRQQALESQAEMSRLKPIIELRKLKQQQAFKEKMIPLEQEARLRAQLELLTATGDQKAKGQLAAFDNAIAQKKMQQEFLSQENQRNRENQLKLQGMKESGSSARASQKSGVEKEPKSDQFKAAGFAKRIEQAEQVFNNLQKAGYNQSTLENSAMKYAPEFAKPENLKMQEQAERNFINSVLRRESGSAIADTEFKSAERQYFPRPNDSPNVLAQKAANRAQVFQALKAESGRAYDKVPSVSVPKKGGNAKVVGGISYEKRSDGKWYPSK